MATGRRVLVTGMGGELGSQVTRMLEEEPWAGRLLGVDLDPPRRRLRRAEFHRILPGQRERAIDLITGFDPHVVVHVGVWEPDARAGAREARDLTTRAATTVLGAAGEGRSLEAVVVRSGLEIYGRSSQAPVRPEESAPVAPTSPYGRAVAEVEAAALRLRRFGATVGALRLAPVVGPHIPSPLGRLLRLPAVPFSALADPPFTVIEASDAARAIVAAARIGLDEPVNVVASGSTTIRRALWAGRRLPIPLIGPEWMLARAITHLVGAPVPEHVLELIHRGRLGDGSRMEPLLGVRARHRAPEVIDALYRWPSVVRQPPRRAWEPVAEDRQEVTAS